MTPDEIKFKCIELALKYPIPGQGHLQTAQMFLECFKKLS